MKYRRKKNKFEGLKEKITYWVLVVLGVSAVLFLKGLLTDMNVQTTRLAEEREKFQDDLTEEREKSKELYREFYAELDDSIKRAIETVKEGDLSR